MTTIAIVLGILWRFRHGSQVSKKLGRKNFKYISTYMLKNRVALKSSYHLELKMFLSGVAVINVFKYSSLFKNSSDFGKEVWDFISPFNICDPSILLVISSHSLKESNFTSFTSRRACYSNIIFSISCSSKASNSPYITTHLNITTDITIFNCSFPSIFLNSYENIPVTPGVTPTIFMCQSYFCKH